MKIVTFNEILEKLKDILSKELGNKKIFGKDIAAAIDMDYDCFRQAKRRGTVPYYEIMQFLAKRHISINYFFFNQLPESLIDATDKFVLLNYQSNITATAGAGGINYYLDPQPMAIDKQLLDHISSSYKYTEILQVHGDSMEPDIKEGSMIFIDRSKTDISKPGIYVVQVKDGLIIKEVIVDEDGGILLKSSNKEYEVQYAKKDKIEILGKVSGQLERI